MKATTSILDEILDYKREFVAACASRMPESEVRGQAEAMPRPASLFEALSAEDDVAVIAEIKKASPSKGLIREDFDPVALGTIYESHGASAISVLTDEKYFQGASSFLTDVNRSVHVPLLRKDFTVDRYQIFEARAIGASAILLIVSALADTALEDFLATANALDLDAVVEVHTPDEAARAVDAGADIIGINNRNLHTFETNLATTETIAASLPPDALVVSESGIGCRADLERVRDAGADAVLVGESLMCEEDVGAKLGELLGTDGG